MRFKVGDCCCTAEIPCSGNNHCYYIEVPGYSGYGILNMPDDIYISVEGEIYNPGYTEAGLMQSGMIPDTSLPQYTGWNITTTITYDPCMFNWFFNQTWKLRNQASWGYERPGEGVPYNDPNLCSIFGGGNPFSGGRLDCWYDWSRTTEINQSLSWDGWYNGSWTYKHYGCNLAGALPLCGGAVKTPECVSDQYITYISPYIITGSNGIFDCGSLFYYNSGDISLLYGQMLGNGWATFYNDTTISPCSINESITEQLAGSDTNIIDGNDCGFGIFGPRIDFSRPSKVYPSETPTRTGHFVLQAVGQTFLESTTEQGIDTSSPGHAIVGIIGNGTSTDAGDTYIASFTAPKLGFSLDFYSSGDYPIGFPELGSPNSTILPLYYGNLAEKEFIPYTGGLNVGTVAASLEIFQDLDSQLISQNYLGDVAGAIISYRHILNGSAPERKTATYKVMSCGVRNITVKFTCDPDNPKVSGPQA